MVEKVYPITFTYLHHAEYAQLVARFIEEYEATKMRTTDEDLTRLLATVKTKLTAMQNALEQVVTQEKSEAVSRADKERDMSIKALFDSIRPYRYTKVLAEKEAYNALHLLFKQYRHAARKSYEEETSLIHSLLEKLKTSEYQPDVTTLGITKFVVNLTESQVQFNKVFTERIKEERTKPKYDVKALRRSLAEDYRLLVAYVGINAQVKSNETYKQVLTIMNSIHKYYADTLARRKGKQKATTISQQELTERMTADVTMEQ
ncbi:DUF6261 family protein [Aerococcaceae bacterium NML160702]|nr:DUF6261 family protein [Aerococcaceae bacterium NML160702]